MAHMGRVDTPGPPRLFRGRLLPGLSFPSSPQQSPLRLAPPRVGGGRRRRRGGVSLAGAGPPDRPEPVWPLAATGDPLGQLPGPTRSGSPRPDGCAMCICGTANPALYEGPVRCRAGPRGDGTGARGVGSPSPSGSTWRSGRLLPAVGEQRLPRAGPGRAHLGIPRCAGVALGFGFPGWGGRTGTAGVRAPAAHAEGRVPGGKARRPLAHECLGEALRVMRQVISKYPLLNTVETLTAAGTLIAKVKAFHYECNNDLEKEEFEKALETIAVAFSST
ncbi:hypothetical protein P7K49_032737 [Saguinus oedipus]|uniref:Rho GTPase-activating protein 29/45 N-terminal domain-containing protein n=1 Tax=Saguinus oedipus TaxID=9490 RepID=A0ABQ9TQP9_SAGOE|nr:hypothetical protein P7K49_032737 [Saguinus oedipus]